MDRTVAPRRPGTVGALVPNDYESVLRLAAPAPSPGAWWASYREVFCAVATVGASHTATADRTWFAIWEGHGFDTATTRLAHRADAGDDERGAAGWERAVLRDEDQRRNRSIRAALAQLPTFALPDRRYYLLHGPVDAAGELSYPGFDGWRNPDLFWPDDRGWFAATDVDFWSLYVAGSRAFTDHLARNAPIASEHVTLSNRIAPEI